MEHRVAHDSAASGMGGVEHALRAPWLPPALRKRSPETLAHPVRVVLGHAADPLVHRRSLRAACRIAACSASGAPSYRRIRKEYMVGTPMKMLTGSAHDCSGDRERRVLLSLGWVVHRLAP